MTRDQAPTTDRIIQGDAATELRALPAGCADVIFADPPYNLQLEGALYRPNNTRVDGVDDDWDRFAGFADYDAFTRDWLEAARHALKADGTLWVIGSYHNIYRVGSLLQDLGYWILNDIVWRKSNPMPNFRGRRFTNAHETLLWVAKSKDSKYRFNYEAMKALNDDLQMRSDWYFPICVGAERLRDDDGAKAHPTQKPEALLHRVLLASTEVGDLVVDPFFGSGTTGAMARKLRRRWIGIERDDTYVEIARHRISKVPPAPDPDLVRCPSRKEEKRIPFGSLIEQGLLEPGTLLYDPKKRFTARVRADGTLISADVTGSIHKVGATLQKAPSCNGWQFWNLDVEGKLVPIDVLRQKLRAELRAE